MNANELMLGNLVFLTKDNFKTKKVYELSSFDIYKLDESNCQDIQPIPLTEKWLLDFGFEEDSCHYTDGKSLFFHDIITTPQNFYLFYDEENNINLSIADDETTLSEKLHLKYVHQLQNLYFALTGNPLQLVEPK